jgi:aspartate oxidase
LLVLERDFLGHQETALVILLKGSAGKLAPAAIVITEDSDVVRVELTPEQQASLAQGGIAQVYHEFVEPRAHVISVGFEGKGWPTAAAIPVTVEAARDRLTFLGLDLTGLDPSREAMGLLTDVWYR